MLPKSSTTNRTNYWQTSLTRSLDPHLTGGIQKRLPCQPLPPDPNRRDKSPRHQRTTNSSSSTAEVERAANKTNTRLQELTTGTNLEALCYQTSLKRLSPGRPLGRAQFCGTNPLRRAGQGERDLGLRSREEFLADVLGFFGDLVTTVQNSSASLAIISPNRTLGCGAQVLGQVATSEALKGPRDRS